MGDNVLTKSHPKAVLVLVSFTALLLGGCPSSTDSALEAAKFALDHCNPADSATSTSCQEAVDQATSILTGDPTNVEAAILASSGYLGLAGIDFLQFAAKLVDVQSNSNADFKEFQDLVNDVESTNARTIDTDQLKSAVDVLVTALAGKTGDTGLNKQGLFQLGATQTLDNFVVPAKLVTIDANGDADPDSITSDVAERLRQNFLTSDDNISASGTDDADTLHAIREGFCLCDDSLFGYSAACLRDLMRCELSDTDPDGTEQDYNNDGTCGTGGVAGTAVGGGTCAAAGGGSTDCDSLTDSSTSAVQSCKDSNTTE